MAADAAEQMGSINTLVCSLGDTRLPELLFR